MEDPDEGDWDMSRTMRRPEQTITEVMQNPHALRLQLNLPPPSPLSPIDRDTFRNVVDATSTGFANPRPATPRYNINDFEQYLRDLVHRYEEYRSLSDYSVSRDAKNRSTVVSSSDEVQVPAVYFAPDFHVALSPNLADIHDLSRQSPAVAALRAALRAQSASVERSIFRAVRERSAEIAAAVNAIDEVRSGSRELVEVTRKLRSSMTTAAADVKVGALRVSAVHHRKENLARILATAERMAEMMQAADDVEVIVEAGNYAAAMDAIDATRAAMEDESLRGVSALANVKRKLEATENTIELSLREAFQAVVVEHHAAVSEEDQVSQSNAPVPVPQRPLFDRDGPMALVIASTVRLGRIDALVQFYLDDIANVVDGIAASVVMSNSSKLETQEKATINGLNGICRSVLIASGTITVINTVVDVCQAEYKIKTNRIKEVVDSFCTTVDDKCTEIVSNIAQDPQRFIMDGVSGIQRFAALIRCGRDVGETLDEGFKGTGSKFRGLRSACTERCRSLIALLHRSQSSALTKLLTREKWVEVKVPTEVQSWVDQLRSVAIIRERVAALDSDPTLRLTSSHGANGSSPKPESLQAHYWKVPDDLSNESADNDADSLMIVSESFKMVPSGLVVLKGVVLYVACATELGRLSPVGGEVVRKCCEYLRSFNETTSKLVLGAGAMRTAGLKSITARHLALASRVVAACLAVASLVDEATSSYIPSSQKTMVAEQLSRVTKDLAEHERQLLVKVKSVMIERLEFHRRALEALSWENEGEMRGEEIPSRSIIALVRETSLLHRILASLLPRPALGDLFVDIGRLYGIRLKDSFDKISLRGRRAKWVKMRVAADANYVHLKLRGMEALGTMNAGAAMRDIERLRDQYGELTAPSPPPPNDPPSDQSRETPAKGDSSAKGGQANAMPPKEKETKPAAASTLQQGQQGEKANAMAPKENQTEPSTAVRPHRGEQD